MPKKRSLEQIRKLDYLKMSDLGEVLGVRYSTIKYYAEQKLLPYHQKGERLAKYYKVKEVSGILKKIQKLKSQKLSIEEIKKKITDEQL